MSSAVPSQPTAAARSVLHIRPFRRLWIGFGLSSTGDWIGLLALTAMARQLAGPSYEAANFAIGGVLFLRVLPALVLAPVAGWIADRLDRRTTMIVGDIARAVLFATIPIVHTLVWVLVVTVLTEMVSLVWGPAKDAAVPNLVPRRQLEQANQISLVTTYGSALPAAAVFVLVTLLGKAVTQAGPGWPDGISLALYLNAASYLVSALAIQLVPQIGRAKGGVAGESVWKTMTQGWRFVATTSVVRGLIVGICGAFAAGAVVIGLGRTYAQDLGAGDPGYGLLFGAVFAGLALGMGAGPKLLAGLSRRRLFAAGLVGAGLCLVAMALIQQIEIATMLAVLLGACAGTSWVSAYTLLGLEVADHLRGRTFAFVASMIRIVLALTLAAAPLVAGLIGPHRFTLDGKHLTYNGAAFTVGIAGVLAVVVGVVAYRQMDDRPGVPFWRDVRRSVGKTPGVYPTRGLFIALEGGEGTGKSTQTDLLVSWLTGQGLSVLPTREPGATALGERLRAIVLDPATGEISDRAEALLYAADKADHVDTVIVPALEAGRVVITDRYVDSSLAYQGSGRALEAGEVERVNRWATDDVRPHLTLVLDADPELAHSRLATGRDRIEAQSLAFHQRVRQAFLDLAAADPGHYRVLDATLGVDDLHAAVVDAVRPVLADADLVRADGVGSAPR